MSPPKKKPKLVIDFLVALFLIDLKVERKKKKDM